MAETNPTLERLEDQLTWYDRQSSFNQAWYKRLKIIQVLTASVIPLAAGLNAPSVVAASLGVIVVISEGLQSLNQFHENWIAYRSTCEELKHEKYLWLAKAGPYAAAKDSTSLLAERIESLISREHAKWVSTLEQVNKQVEKDSTTNP